MNMANSETAAQTSAEMLDNAPAGTSVSSEFYRYVLKPHIILANSLLSRFGYVEEVFGTGWS